VVKDQASMKDYKNHSIPAYSRYFLFIAAFCILTVKGMSQVKFYTKVNEKEIAQNEYLQVEYTIENAKSVDKFSISPFKNFQVIQGPIQASGMSVTNGVMSEYKGLSYILQPTVTGTLSIPGASAIIDGKPMQSNMVKVVVSRAGSINKVPPSQGFSPPSAPLLPQVDEEYTLSMGENIADKIKKNLIVVAEVNKTSCYEGEPIVATYKLYSRLRSESRVIKRPSLNGFSVFDMMEPESNNPGVETLHGRSYNVHLIRKTQLFPLQAGTFILDPVELENKVRFIKTKARKPGPQTSMDQLIDEFLSDEGGKEAVEHVFTLASKPVTITVKPLPPGKPENFNGAVGSFKIKADLKKNNVAAGDAIELHVQIKGQGNFTVINSPLLTLPGDMESFDPAIKEDLDKTVYPLNGTKSFDFILTARDTGDYQIPPIIFSFFDPSSALYKTLKSDSFKIHVGPAVKKKNQFSLLRNNSALSEKSLDGFPVKAALLSLAVIFVAGLGLYQWRIKSKHVKSKKAVTTENKNLSKPVEHVKRDELKEAKWALQVEESQRFYREVNKAAWRVMSEKLNLSATEQNKFNAISKLKLKGVSPEIVQKLESVLNECEMALYTPVHDITDMQHTLKKAEEVLKVIQVSVPNA
jgi:hypothetical protein